MYTLNKLENMAMLFGNNNIDGILASYFIHSLDELSHMTLQKCMNDTGVSKASLNRFYKKAGFNNFKNFISVLMEENRKFSLSSNDYIYDLILYLQDSSFDSTEIKKFVDHLKIAKQVMFYGNQSEIDCFRYTTHILREKGITVSYLNMWEIDAVYEKINNLKSNDIFVIVDSSYNIQNLNEVSINNNYLVTINQLKERDFKKFYIGEVYTENHIGFETIKVPDSKDEYKNIMVEILDKMVAKELKM